MRPFWKLLATVTVATALTATAHAGEPGRKPLQPLYQSSAPSTTTYYHSGSTTTYTAPSSTYGSTQSDVRNQSEYNRLQAIPAPQTRYVYPQSQPAYTPAPGYTTTRSYTSAPPPAPRYVPAPAPTYSHCGQQYQTTCATQYTSAPTIVGGPVYAPPMISPVSCGDDVIKRLDDTKDGRRQYSVCYADLMHMTPYDRNTKLLDRIEKASDKACRDYGNSVLSHYGTRRKCEKETLEASVMASGLPGLVDAYYVKTGKRRPNVSVGAPIMN